jgi:hypothetical protein
MTEAEGPGKSFDEYDVVLERARQLIEDKKPDASPQKKAAFANGVACLVTGWSGGYGGPSVREHAVNSVINKLGIPGQISFEVAVEELIKSDGVIFGPITDLHRMIWAEEHCSYDDPEDVVELEGR